MRQLYLKLCNPLAASGGIRLGATDLIPAKTTPRLVLPFVLSRPGFRVCHSAYLARPNLPLVVIAVPATKTFTDSLQLAALRDHSVHSSIFTVSSRPPLCYPQFRTASVQDASMHQLRYCRSTTVILLVALLYQFWSEYSHDYRALLPLVPVSTPFICLCLCSLTCPRIVVE